MHRDSGIVNFIGHILALAETNDDIELGVCGELKSAEVYVRAGRFVQMEEYFEIRVCGEENHAGVACDSLALAWNVEDRQRYAERRSHFISVRYPLLFTDKKVLLM